MEGSFLSKNDIQLLRQLEGVYKLQLCSQIRTMAAIGHCSEKENTSSLSVLAVSCFKEVISSSRYVDEVEYACVEVRAPQPFLPFLFLFIFPFFSFLSSISVVMISVQHFPCPPYMQHMRTYPLKKIRYKSDFQYYFTSWTLCISILGTQISNFVNYNLC